MSAGARMLLWQQARVSVNSAIREAVNVYPLEYIVARHYAGKPAGALVSSELSSPNPLTLTLTLILTLTLPP